MRKEKEKTRNKDSKGKKKPKPEDIKTIPVEKKYDPDEENS